MLVAFVVAGLFVGAAPAQEARADLVVLFVSGWRTTNVNAANELGWKTIRADLEREYGDELAFHHYSYTHLAADYESIPEYRLCDTNQSISVSAQRLGNQLTSLSARYRGAKVLIVGHSLGGVVPSYWAATAHSRELEKLAGVVTIDSPVAGLSLLIAQQILALTGAPAGSSTEIVRLILEGSKDYGCGGAVVDELDPLSGEAVLETISDAPGRLQEAGVAYYNGASCLDPFITCHRAKLQGGEHETFWSTDASCKGVVDVTSVLWAFLTRTSPRLDLDAARRCLLESHGAPLEDPAVLKWVSEIAEQALTDHSLAPAEPGSSVRDIDWLNRSYKFGVPGGESVTVVDGARILPYAGGMKPPAYGVEPPIFADLTGDGIEEAVIVQGWTDGSTGSFSSAQVFTVQGGEPIRIHAFATGDRADGGEVAIVISGTELHVTRNDLQPNHGLCCKTHTRTELWRWDGTRFVEDVSRRTIRPIDNIEPAGTISLKDAIETALLRLNAPNRQYGGDCDSLPLGTMCSNAPVALGSYQGFPIGLTGTEGGFGTVIVQPVAGGVRLVAWEPASLWGLDYLPLKVNGRDGCVNVRAEPNLRGRIVDCLVHGTAVRVLGPMAYADGYVWAPIDRGGFIAARWLCVVDDVLCPDMVSANIHVFE